MKKNRKNHLLITAALLAVSGIIICIVTAGMAGDFKRIVPWPEVRFGNCVFISFRGEN